MLFILFPLSVKLKLATRDIIAYSFPFYSPLCFVPLGVLRSGVLGEAYSCISKLLLEEEKIQNTEFFVGVFSLRGNFLMPLIVLYSIKGGKIEKKV